MLGQLDTFIAFVVVILGFSLLITILNQAIVALVAMRGTNLLWGIQTLLEQVDPRLAPHARTISEEVLRHPLISDSTMSKARQWRFVGPLISRWKLGSAIRADELVNILRMVAKKPPGPSAGAASTTPTAGDWRHLLWMTLEDDHEKAKARIQEASQALQAVAPAAHAQLQTLAPQVVSQVQKAVGDIELWFDSVMDRVSQRFAVRMRVWTVIWAIIVAFTLHIDASDLLRQIREDPGLRARLVASTDALNRQAETVLNAAVPDVYGKALARLRAEAPELKDVPPSPAAATRAAVMAWISQSVPPDQAPALAARLDLLVRDEFKDVLDRLRGQASDVDATLAAAGLRIIPDYDLHVRKDGWPDWWLYTEVDPSKKPPVVSRWNRHFFGVLFSAMLLSLGAPFWFMILKSTATLRPVVASREKEERAQRG